MSAAAMLPGGIAATTAKYVKGLKLGDKLVDGAKILTKNADEVAEGAVKAEKALDGADRTRNLAHNVARHQKLKDTLSVEEVRSVVDTTKHGAERLLERGFTPTDISALKLVPDKTMSQIDGAKVYIKSTGNGKYNVIVEGENGVVTALKNIGQKLLNRLSNNYGWK